MPDFTRACWTDSNDSTLEVCYTRMRYINSLLTLTLTFD